LTRRYVGVFVVALAAALPAATHGMNWSDTGQSFHFACRILRGDFPYRDFSYQSGFAGLFLHAAAMKVFGAQALVDVAVRLVAAALGVVALTFLVGSVGSAFAATAIGLGAAVLLPVTFTDLLYAGGNEQWATLFAFAGGALFARAAGSDRPAPGAGLATFAAGFFFALVIGARQGEGLVIVAVVAAVTAILAAGGRLKAPVRFAALLAGGVAAGWILLAGALAAGSALGPGLEELFANAAQKKTVDPVKSVGCALIGSLAVAGTRSIHLFVWPDLAAVAGVAAFAWPGRLPRGVRTTGLLLVPALVLIGALLAPFGGTHLAGLALMNHPTRVVLSLGAVWMCLGALRRGAEPALPPGALMLALVPLALTWGHGLSFSGFEDAPRYLLAVPCVALACADPRLPRRWRRATGSAFVAVAVLLWIPHAVTGNLSTNDGRVRAADEPLDHPMTRGIRVVPAKAIALDALREKIRPGDSLFIYGSAAPLYTLLEARNPTRLDVTFPDAFTVEQARRAVEALHADPPRWIIEAVNLHHAFLGRDDDGSPGFYGPHGQEGPRILHHGLVAMRRKYRRVFVVHEVVGYERMEKREPMDWDDVTNLRLWERRD
jgi:hypothetical protein